MVEHAASLFDLSGILTIGGGVLVLCSLLRLPIVKLFREGGPLPWPKSGLLSNAEMNYPRRHTR